MHGPAVLHLDDFTDMLVTPSGVMSIALGEFLPELIRRVSGDLQVDPLALGQAKTWSVTLHLALLASRDMAMAFAGASAAETGFGGFRRSDRSVWRAQIGRASCRERV